jgi:iron complex outermembrane receptor protein
VFYEEQVVTASRGEAQSPLELPNSTAIITEQDIRLSGITKIPELLRRVAGIDIMQMTGGTTEVSMRGFNQRLSNKLLVLVDGRSTFVDYFGATAWESFSIDVDQIERIEVVRGPGSALYGADAFGGVVNIITRAPGTGRNGIRVGFGDHNQAFGSMQVTGRDGDFAYRASAGYTRHPNWTMDYSPSRVDLDANKRYPDVSTELSRIDLRTTRKLGKDISLDVGGGLTRGFLNVINLGGFREWDYSDTATGDLTAALQFKKVRTRVFYNYYRWGRVSAAYVYKGQDSYVSPFAANVVDAESVYADQVPLGPTTHQINLGLNYRLRNASAIYTGRDRTEHHFGIFGQDSVKLTPTTTLVLSGRIDRVPYTGMFEGSPRTSMLWNPAPRSTVRTSFSTAFRKPTFLEGYAKFPVQPPQGSLSSITDTEALERLYGSSGRLRVERVLTAEVGYINQQSDIVDVDVAAYYNRVSDLITLAPPMPLTLSQRKDGEANLDLGTGRYPAQQTGFVNQCVIFHVVGGEAGVRTYPFKGLDLFANYALNMVHEERPGACEIPADQRTSQHKLNAGAQVRTPLGIQGEVTFHYVSDQRWVERDLDSSSGTLVYRTLPLAGYPLVNARVGYRFAGDHAEVAATAFNLLGHEHQQHPLGQTVGQRFMGFFRYEF